MLCEQPKQDDDTTYSRYHSSSAMVVPLAGQGAGRFDSDLDALPTFGGFIPAAALVQAKETRPMLSLDFPVDWNRVSE